MAISSRFRKPTLSSAALASKIALYFLSSVWFMASISCSSGSISFYLYSLARFSRNQLDEKPSQRFQPAGPLLGATLCVSRPATGGYHMGVLSNQLAKPHTSGGQAPCKRPAGPVIPYLISA